MRILSSLLVSASLFANGALAAVNAETQARLGKDLTPVGQNKLAIKRAPYPLGPAV